MERHCQMGGGGGGDGCVWGQRGGGGPHLRAGLRFLVLDIEVGIPRNQARVTALLVNIIAAIAAVSIVWGCL